MTLLTPLEFNRWDPKELHFTGQTPHSINAAAVAVEWRHGLHNPYKLIKRDVSSNNNFKNGHIKPLRESIINVATHFEC